ncbi:MAG: serine/threonine-protein kinase [Planctomycetota bacterium]
MQIRCTTCTKTIAIAPTGALPPACPHCLGAPVPARVGPFVPQRLIATGGMGEVYLAEHSELGTEVALKLLPAMPLDAAASVRERFAREARLTARVPHPGVVRVLDCDVAGDRPYLVLELVDGQTLRQRLDKGPLPIVEAARIVAATADVLAAAHAHGVLHRDVKPDNVMLTGDGSVRVLDFGIARALSDDAPLTRTGEILGTPEYMAPEQLLDGPEATDERTDVHALGVLLFELLTARSPFHGANLFQALKLVESLVPPKPSSLRKGVPPGLDAVVARALQKQREHRPPSALAFAAAVREAVPGAAAAAPTGTARANWRVWLPIAAMLPFGLICSLVALRLFDSGPATNRTAGADDRVQIAVDAATTRAELAHMLAIGHWSAALLLAEQAVATGDEAALPLAQEAFLLSHYVWPLACGAPQWLCACDERQRHRLFGDDSEPAATAIGLRAVQTALFADAPSEAFPLLEDGTTPVELRLRLVAAHAAGADDTRVRALHADPALLDDATARLLRIPCLPPTERSAAFAEVAARLPLDAPEHWLAQRAAIAFDANADAAAAGHAAEMAWLCGAGELAVLFDASLLAIAPAGHTFPRLTADRALRLARRLAVADPVDTPASLVLQVALAATTSARPFDAGPLTTLPRALKPAVAHWFVAAATPNPLNLTTLLRAAARVGAAPDYATSPWRDLTEAARREIASEAEHAPR